MKKLSVAIIQKLQALCFKFEKLDNTGKRAVSEAVKEIKCNVDALEYVVDQSLDNELK